MNKTFVKILIALSLFGMGLAFILVTQHYNLLKKGFEEKSFCSINEFIDCDVVNASSYADIFSIPVAGLGLIFYFIIFIYSSIAQASSAHKKDSLLFCFYLSFLALLFTIYMAYVSFFKLEVICLLCIGMYLLNLFIFLLFPPALRTKFREIPSLTVQYLRSLLNLKNSLGFKSRSWVHAGISCLIFGIGIFILMNMSVGFGQEKPKISEGQIIKAHFAQKKFKINPGNRPMWGNKEAPITIVDFSDYQCPYCRVAAFNIKPALAEFKNKIAFYYVNYPLDMSCNPHMQRQLHRQACLAARASLCAHQENKFWEYHDLIFKNQRRLSKSKFLDLAKLLEIDRNQFNACLDSEKINNLVLEDIELAKKNKVSGTPSIFVNGRKLRAWGHRGILRAIIEEEIKRSEK